MRPKRSSRRAAIWLAVILLVSWFGANLISAANTETVYTVRPGDSWWKIGRKYGVPYQALAEHNGKRSTDTIYAGQKLYIPGTGSSADDQPGGTRLHKVVRGDTWWGLGRTYGVPYREIAAYNGMRSSDTIYVGQTLKIPTSGETAKPTPSPTPGGTPKPTPTPTPSTPSATYRVKRGDTWWSIAQRHGLSYRELARHNGKQPTEHIYVGQILKLPDGGTPEEGATPTPVPTPTPTPNPKPLTDYSNARNGWSWLYGARDEQTLRSHDAYFRSPDRRSKVIYLTFDCGYEHKQNTAKTVDILKRHGAKASFFLNGQIIRTDPATIRRMVDDGHAVGNHGEHHVAIHSSVAAVQRDVRSLNTTFKNLTGRDLDPIYRPPSGEWSRRGLELVRREGYRTFFWTYAYRDWDVNKQMSPSSALRALKQNTSPGMILLLHSISDTNVEVLGDYIDWAHAQGYEFRTLKDFPD